MLPEGSDRNNPDARRAAAYYAVMAAGVSYAKARFALEHVVRLAHGYGLPADEIMFASGLDSAAVDRILEDGAG